MVTRTALTNPSLEMSAEPEMQPKGTSTPYYLGPDKESSARFWTARMHLHKKLIGDYLRDTMVMPFSRKRSYLVTRNEDGSLDWTAVELGFPEIPMEPGDTSLCRAISKTEKL